MNVFDIVTKQLTARRSERPALHLQRTVPSKAHALLQLLQDGGAMTARELTHAAQLSNSGLVGALLKHHLRVGRVVVQAGRYAINPRYERQVVTFTPGLRQLVEWIPVASGKLPDDDTTVMIALADDDEEWWLGYLDGDTWRNVEGRPVEVTHWAHMVAGPQSNGGATC